MISYYTKLWSHLICLDMTLLKSHLCCQNPLNTLTKVTGIIGVKTVQLKNSLSKHCFLKSDRCWQCCLVMSLCAKTLTSKWEEGWIYKTENGTESFSVQHLLRPGKPSHQFCCSNERLSSSCQPFNHQPAPWPSPWHNTEQPTNEQPKPCHRKTILGLLVQTHCTHR